MNPEHAVQITVRAVANRLSDDELSALNIAMQLDEDPRELPGYEMARSLFTQAKGQRAHEAVKQAFAAAVLDRLG